MTWEEAAIRIGQWIVGAVGGGFIFKTGLEKWEQRKRRMQMRRQLYEGIALNYQSLIERVAIATSTEGIKQGTPFRFKGKLNLYFAAWENYSSVANKALLFTLDEALTIQSIYESFLVLNFVVDDNPYETLNAARIAVANVDESILNNKIDNELFKKVASQEVSAFIADLIAGRRKSYKTAINPF